MQIRASMPLIRPLPSRSVTSRAVIEVFLPPARNLSTPRIEAGSSSATLGTADPGVGGRGLEA